MRTLSSLDDEEVEQRLMVAKRRGSARRRRRQLAAELAVLVGFVGVSLGWASASSGAIARGQVATSATAPIGPVLTAPISSWSEPAPSPELFL